MTPAPDSVCVCGGGTRLHKASGLYQTVIGFQGPWADLWFIRELGVKADEGEAITL